MNTLTACKQYIASKGCTLWRDWDVSTSDGLDKAAAALRDDVDGVVTIKTEAKAAAIGLPVGVPENFAGSPYFQGQQPDPLPYA